jgi:hypothetical protein
MHCLRPCTVLVVNARIMRDKLVELASLLSVRGNHAVQASQLHRNLAAAYRSTSF